MPRCFREEDVAGFAIGEFSATDAEPEAFLDATGSKEDPRYWEGGGCPAREANHPVANGNPDTVGFRIVMNPPAAPK